jgi:hypothetical protein
LANRGESIVKTATLFVLLWLISSSVNGAIILDQSYAPTTIDRITPIYLVIPKLALFLRAF